MVDIFINHKKQDDKKLALKQNHDKIITSLRSF